MGWNITDAQKLEEAIFELKLKLAHRIGVQSGMTVVDMGCGQGGFTAALAKTVGKKGKVLAVDVSNEYLSEFMERLNRYDVRNNVIFIHKDAVSLKDAIADEIADIVASFRLLEELKESTTMPKIVKEMVHIVKKGCKVCIIELNARTQNDAEETYVRLHRESGDSLFEPEEIVEAMKEAQLGGVRLEKLGTDIWFSPQLAKQDLGFAQVWFDEDVKRTLGYEIDRYGMKYPSIHIFSGVKT
jgi:cyclopropane fatty-acyl-phospholipid synthase-like methyltransferase